MNVATVALQRRGPLRAYTSSLCVVSIRGSAATRPPQFQSPGTAFANGLPAETCQLIQILEAPTVVLHFKRPVIRIKSDDRHKLLYPNGCTCDVNQSIMNTTCIMLTMLS